MPTKVQVRAEAKRLMALFVKAGAHEVATDILQPADILLDLYGEDIRSRAFVTQDPLQGEHMLRPDFTVPVVQMHMNGGAEPARYTYSGEIFRRQETQTGRPSEYIQVGFEVFDRQNPTAADAEVFALMVDVLKGRGLRAATGDIGILMAAVRALDTTDRRKAALLRHIWRPNRFRALLERFGGNTPVPPSRVELLSKADPLSGLAPHVGLRGLDEVEERVAALRQDATEAPIPANQVVVLEKLVTLRARAADSVATLESFAREMPAMADAVQNFEKRLSALQQSGIDVSTLEFEASYGRTSMEYYDGFVFGFHAEARPELPPIASGGRYDALTRVLGQGKSIPAIGGVIRPGLLLELAEGAV